MFILRGVSVNPTRPTRSRNPNTKPPRYVRIEVYVADCSGCDLVITPCRPQNTVCFTICLFISPDGLSEMLSVPAKPCAPREGFERHLAVSNVFGEATLGGQLHPRIDPRGHPSNAWLLAFGSCACSLVVCPCSRRHGFREVVCEGFHLHALLHRRIWKD